MKFYLKQSFILLNFPFVCPYKFIKLSVKIPLLNVFVSTINGHSPPIALSKESIFSILFNTFFHVFYNCLSAFFQSLQNMFKYIKHTNLISTRKSTTDALYKRNFSAKDFKISPLLFSQSFIDYVCLFLFNISSFFLETFYTV